MGTKHNATLEAGGCTETFGTSRSEEAWGAVLHDVACGGSYRQACLLLRGVQEEAARLHGGVSVPLTRQIPFNHTWVWHMVSTQPLFLPKDPGVQSHPRLPAPLLLQAPSRDPHFRPPASPSLRLRVGLVQTLADCIPPHLPPGGSWAACCPVPFHRLCSLFTDKDG